MVKQMRLTRELPLLTVQHEDTTVHPYLGKKASSTQTLNPLSPENYRIWEVLLS